MGSIAPAGVLPGAGALLDITAIPCRINYMPHGSTVESSVVARLAFACRSGECLPRIIAVPRVVL